MDPICRLVLKSLRFCLQSGAKYIFGAITRKQLLAIAVLLILCAVAFEKRCEATDLLPASPASKEVSKVTKRANSILVFAGRMSTTDIFSTAMLNLNQKGVGQLYDNYIAGAAYDRDLLDIGLGFHLGVEVGIADRFGNFKRCCDIPVISDSIVQSAELWVGPQLRYEGVVLFNFVRVAGGITIGISAVTPSIGREFEREIESSGRADLLYYLGPELDLSLPNRPNTELVFKLQHRSGGKDVSFLPKLGNMAEGYNANVVGIRYRF